MKLRRRAHAHASLKSVLALAAVLLVGLVAVPTAQASKGIVGWFGSEDQTLRDVAGALSSPIGVAVNSTGAGGVPAGTVYVAERRRIDRFSPSGVWVDRWGWNVVGANERQAVTVDAQGGTFKLTFGGNTTSAIAYNASASTVQSALTSLPSIGSGNVTVQATCSFSCTAPFGWNVTFTAALDGTDVPSLEIDGSELTGVNSVDGGAPLVNVETLANGAGGSDRTYEICTEPSLCDAGEATPAPAPNGGISSDGLTSIAIDQTDGSVYVVDRGFRRVQKFSATGTPLLVFGKNVNATQPSTASEVCTATSGDACQTGSDGTAGGEFTRPNTSYGEGIAVVPEGLSDSGNLIVTDSLNHRVQEFTSEGEFIRAFGWDVISSAAPDNDPANEVQQVTVPGTDGTFTLSFGSSTTPALAFDADAATVQAALNSLSSVSTGGGSVSVTGGPGDATGSSPYVITFDGGPRADTDVAQMTVNGRGLGTPPGATVTCVGPNDRGFKMTTEYQWLRNGTPIAGETASTYQITAADEGTAIQCQESSVFDPDQVTSSFDDEPLGPGAGSVQASVPVINVSPLPTTPRPTPPDELPEITATFLPGQSRGVGEDGGFTLHCQTGTWGGSPTFTYQWYRSGVPLAGHGADTKDYIVQPADLATPAIFQCAVKGTNASGSVVRISSEPSFAGDAKTSPDPDIVPNADPSGAQIADTAKATTVTTGASFEICTVATECKAGVQGFIDSRNVPDGVWPAGEFARGGRVAVDDTGAIYVVDTFPMYRVTKLSPQAGPPSLSPSIFGSIGAPNSLPYDGVDSPDQESVAVAIGEDNHVLVLREYDPGLTEECLDGSESTLERRVQEISEDGTELLDTHGTCSGVSASGSTAGLATNLDTGDIYETIDNGAHRVYILGGANNSPQVDLDAPVPTATNAFVTGTIIPDPSPTGYPHPPRTSWQLEYKLSSASEWAKFRQPMDVGAGSDPVPFKITLTPLLPNSSYDVRAVATKEFNSSQTIGSPKTFTTGSAPPSIESVKSLNVTVSSADLNARINPRGSDTTYHFEYGTTEAYGQATAEMPAGSGQGAESLTQHIDGLQDSVYHFRVVAQNEAGTTASEDQTFVFHPPECPNQLLRQQTGASYLPDCRAYELVSPAQAGNTVINSFTGPWSPNATNPSRLAYLGMFSPLPDSGNPPNNQDLYVSTRTTDGWKTRYVGLPAEQAYIFGGPPGPLGTAGYLMRDVQASPDLSKILLWNLGDPEVVPSGSSNAPYVFGADGQVLDRLPSGVESVAGGTEFKTQVFQLAASADLSHFIFSSDVPFVPGGQPTDIYDNDTDTGTISIVNRDPNDVPFAGYPLDVSADGSHILMSTSPVPVCPDEPCPAIPPGHFYMRIAGSQTFDVTKGHNVSFAGMTRDGSKVYFLSDEQVTSTDHDGSTDLFMWDEATDSVNQVSSGSAGTGNADDCSAVDSWTSGCSITLVGRYERQCASNCGDSTPKPRFYNGEYNNQLAAAGGHPWNDNFLASGSGDIYFFSPEKLSGPSKGAEGMQNLYVFHAGSVQFVTSFDPDPVCALQGGSFGDTEYCASGPIGRMQVTSDGAYAAFTATSRITGYDNHGVEEMYRYSTSSGGLVCVSCVPSGEKPTGPVFGSENGLFITTDGRTFFSTADALSPDDTNEAQDVYEYVGGRPQLITQGTGEVTEALCPQCGLGQFSAAGLIGVSANGQDVYFGTYDVLTAQDHNGGNLKIYDARTNGGFNFEPPPPPCEAADECHGNAAGPPPPLTQGTTVDLGAQGNLPDPGEAQRCGKKARAAQRASKHAKALRRRAANGRALQRRARRATLAARRLRKRAGQCSGRNQKKRKRSQHRRNHAKRGASR